MYSTKSPKTARTLSFFFPGLGHYYVYSLTTGILWSAGAVFILYQIVNSFLHPHEPPLVWFDWLSPKWRELYHERYILWIGIYLVFIFTCARNSVAYTLRQNFHSQENYMNKQMDNQRKDEAKWDSSRRR